MKVERSLIVHCEGPTPAVLETDPPGGPTDGVAQVWYGTLPSLQDRAERYHALLDNEELARAARFRFPHDRQRYIIGHGLLRETLGRYLGLSAKDLVLLRGEFGKPYLEGHPIHFNLSDTKDAVLVALSKHPIGVDIETMQRRVDHLAVSEHYFTPEEVEAIALSSDTKRRFLEYWTRKEAVLKASGVGIMDDLKVLRVDGGVNRMTIQHEAFMALAAEEYHVHTWMLGTDHVISVASERELAEVRIIDASNGYLTKS